MRALAKDVPYDIHRVFDLRTVGMASPNRIIFGCGAAEKIGEEARQMAKGKALVISDEVLEKIGTVDSVKAKLEAAGFEVATFAKVEPEPHTETALAIYNDNAGKGVSLLVGVGGGSVMDMGKLSAQCLGNTIDPRKIIRGEVVPEKRGLPLIQMPTTSGTGSEVSPIFVVTDGKNKAFKNSPFFYSDISIVDPLLTVSMPPLVTATTGLDALSHAIEGMMNKNANPLCDILCLGGIELAGAYLRQAVANGEDLEARFYMALASTLSMMGMVMSGGLYAHSVAYIVSKFKPTPHGLGCALGLPFLMAYNAPVIEAKMKRIAEALGESTDMLADIDAARLAAQSIYCLMADVGLPTSLEEYGGIDESQLEEAAGLMMELYPRPLNPRPMSRDQAIAFWQNMWTGELDF